MEATTDPADHLIPSLKRLRPAKPKLTLKLPLVKKKKRRRDSMESRRERREQAEALRADRRDKGIEEPLRNEKLANWSRSLLKPEKGEESATRRGRRVKG